MSELPTYSTAGQTSTLTLKGATKHFLNPKYGDPFKVIAEDRPDDELVKSYVDFVRHQPMHWLHHLPPMMKDRGSLSQAKLAVLHMATIPAIVEQVGDKKMKSMVNRVRREITTEEIEKEVSRRATEGTECADSDDSDGDESDDSECSEPSFNAVATTPEPTLLDDNARIRAACLAYADISGKVREAAVLRALWQDPAPETDKTALIQVFEHLCKEDDGAMTVFNMCVSRSHPA